MHTFEAFWPSRFAFPSCLAFGPAPGPLGSPLGTPCPPPWIPLGPLGSPLGPPWVPLGPPWVPLGSLGFPWVPSWVPLGPPWVPLGPPWVPLGPLGSPLWVSICSPGRLLVTSGPHSAHNVAASLLLVISARAFCSSSRRAPSTHNLGAPIILCNLGLSWDPWVHG